jgi:clathrin heavy chain
VYIAYAKGFCDDELIAITNDNSMFKQQARYLVKRRQPELYAQVLVSDNLHRHQFIDQVSVIALLVGQLLMMLADNRSRPA